MVDFVMTEPPRLSSAADKRNVRWVYRPSLPVQHACVKNGEYGVVRYSSDPDYLSDMETFLRPSMAFDPNAAWVNVRNRLVEFL